MPVIEIVCSADFFPPDDVATLTRAISPQQDLVIQMTRCLPFDILGYSSPLQLEEDTPEEGVTVLLRRFHAYDVNVPDLWFIVQFSEAAPNDEDQVVIREVLKELFEGYLFHKVEPTTKRALDIFWGPSRGYIAGMTPTPIKW